MRPPPFPDCQTRYQALGDGLWRSAVDAFVAVLTSGIPALSLSDDVEACARSWDGVSTACEAFLLGPQPPPVNGAAPASPSQGGADEGEPTSSEARSTSLPPRTLEEDEERTDAEVEASVLDVLTDDVLTSRAVIPEDALIRLVSIVDRGLDRPRSHDLAGVSVLRVGEGGEREERRGEEKEGRCRACVWQAGLPLCWGGVANDAWPWGF